MRALLRVAVIVETLLTLACSRSIARTAPSAAPSTSTSTSVARNTTAQAGSPSFEPPLAQLDLVSNDLDSADHQPLLFLFPDPPIIPPTPILPQRALDFYVRANGVLGNICVPQRPPIDRQLSATLDGIVGQANRSHRCGRQDSEPRHFRTHDRSRLGPSAVRCAEHDPILTGRRRFSPDQH